MSAGLRVLFFTTVAPGDQAAFLAAYDEIRHRVAEAPGHLTDQLCQSAIDPRHWLITSEWTSPAHYSAWANHPGFAALSAPILKVIGDREHRPFLVRSTTPDPPSRHGGG